MTETTMVKRRGESGDGDKDLLVRTRQTRWRYSSGVTILNFWKLDIGCPRNYPPRLPFARLNSVTSRFSLLWQWIDNFCQKR